MALARASQASPARRGGRREAPEALANLLACGAEFAEEARAGDAARQRFLTQISL